MAEFTPEQKEALRALQQGGAPTSTLHLPEGQTGKTYVDPSGEVFSFGGPSLGVDPNAARANEPALSPEAYPELRKPDTPPGLSTAQPRASQLTQDVTGVPMGVESPGAPRPQGRPTGVNLRGGGGFGGGAYARIMELRNTPTEYRGGYDLPVGRDELEAEFTRLDQLEAEGKLTEAEADQRRDYLGRNWKKWMDSPQGLSARLQRQQREAQRKQAGFQLEGMEAQAQGMEAIGEAREGLRDDLQTHEQVRELKRAAYLDAREDQMRRWEQAQKEAANFRIDPDAYMSKQGGWGQLRTGIALALGQAGASLAGGPNAALGMLERRIDRDIEAQKEQLNSKRGAADAQGNLLARMRQQYADDAQATAAAKQFLLQQAALEVQSISDASKPQAVRRRGEALSQGLQDRAAMQETARQLVAEQQKLAELNALMMRGRGGGGGKSKARTTKGIRDARAQARRVKDVVNRVKALRAGLGLGDWASQTFDWVPGVDPTDNTKAAMAAQRELMQANQRGVLTDADERSLSRFVPGGMTLKEVITSPDTKVLDTMLTKAEEALRAESASDLPVEYIEQPVTAERERRKEADR